MSGVPGGKEYPKVGKGSDELLWEWEFDGGICPLQLSILHKIEATVWSATENFSTFMDPVLPKWGEFS